MIRVVLTDEAYDAIASTLPKGTARWPMRRDRCQWLHPSRGGGGRPHQGHAQAQLELLGRHPEARPASSSTEVGMRLPPKMTSAQIAEAQRMAREWKRLVAPGKSRSECALDERAAPRTGRVFCSAYGARWRLLTKLGVALAQPVQSRFDPHHGFDAEADLFPFVRAKPLNQARLSCGTQHSQRRSLATSVGSRPSLS
jgi:hypothetical protein